MRAAQDRPSAGEADKHSEIRRQFITLIRTGRRTRAYTAKRPTDVRFPQVLHPESRSPLTESGMWREIARLLESEIPLTAIVLDQPPGENAWVFCARLAPDLPLIYVKLQMRGGSTVLLHSFHASEHDHD